MKKAGETRSFCIVVNLMVGQKDPEAMPDNVFYHESFLNLKEAPFRRMM